MEPASPPQLRPGSLLVLGTWWASPWAGLPAEEHQGDGSRFVMETRQGEPAAS